MSENNTNRVQAYLDSITYKFKIESNARIVNFGPITGIQFPQFLEQPWPRTFKYRWEFYVYEASPTEVFDSINAFFQGSSEEYVLNVFSPNLAVQIPAYKDLDYLHAWNNVLMELKLSPSSAKITPNPLVRIKSVESIQDVAMINALEPDFLSSTRGLQDEHIHNLMAFFQNEISAKAQIITLDQRYAFLADMFTHPDFRRKGISIRLLEEMHSIAKQQGASHALLVPSRMTREIELYQKFHYREVLPIALLVPPKK